MDVHKVVSIVIDNSALNNLLNSPDLIKQFEARLASRKLRVLIPFDAITEATSGSDLNSMHARLSKLGGLVESYPNEVILARDAGVWVRQEWCNGGFLNNIPHFRNSPRFPGVLSMLKDKDEFQRLHGEVGEFRAEGIERKAELKARDQEFRAQCARMIPKEETLKLLAKVRDLAPISSFDALGDSFAFLPGFSRTKIKRAYYSRSRFKVLKCFLSLFYVRALANSIDPKDCPAEYQALVKISEGNWYDLSLIVAASSQDYLVSDDVGQRAVTNFANQRGFVKCSAVTLKEFLATPVGQTDKSC